MTITATPTTYAGIHMRSRLEASYAQYLDDVGSTWTYEPNAFASPDGQYLPDFRVTHAGREYHTYVEVKPDKILTNRKALEKALNRMKIIWASEPDASLTLAVGHYNAGHTRSIFSTLFWTPPGRRYWLVRTPHIQTPLMWGLSDEWPTNA